MTVGLDIRGLPRWARLHVVDLAVMLGMVVPAYVLRRWGLPHDGLWYDDAWVAGGAVFGSPSDVAMTGGAHPGFTMLLWLQHRVLGGPPEHLALIAFVFGVLGPSLLYLGLRSLRYGKPGSFLAAAALLVTPSHVIYSARVKSYSLDVVVVMLVAAAIPRLAARRWTWWGTAGWVAAAVAVGSLSGYQMLATAVAMGILVIHSNGDRWQRLTALVVQGVIQGGWVMYARRFVDLDEIEAFMQSAFDAHVDGSRNPIELAGNVFDHFTRIVYMHPGAPARLLTVVALGILAGLLVGAVGRLDRQRMLASQFALAALVIAAVGGVLDRFPFGPSNHDMSTAIGAPGARHGLWLVPVMAIGLCNLIDLTGRVLARKAPAQVLGPARVLSATVVAAALLLVNHRWQPAEREKSAGGHELAAAVETEIDRGAYLVMDDSTTYQYMLLTGRHANLEPTPKEMVGYLPVPARDVGVVIGPSLTPDVLARFAKSTSHDLLVVVGIDLPYADGMTRSGWSQVRTVKRGGYRATVWRRTGAAG